MIRAADTGRISDEREAEPCRAARAFTLIELLVVIAIIVLLVGILLPALGAARETARSVVCLSIQRQTGIGVATYGASFKDALVGPNSSGAAWQVLIDPNVNPIFGNTTGETPVSNHDWMTPILSVELNANRAKRTKQIFEQFGCAATKQKYQAPFGGGLDYPDFEAMIYGEGIKQNSYLSPYGFHYYPSSASAQRNRISFNGFTAAPYSVPSSHYTTVRPAENYTPSLNRIGVQPSRKVFAMDGTRYLDRATQTFDFDISVNPSIMGSFLESSPVYVGATAYGQNAAVSNGLVPDSWKLSLRHPGYTVNAVFFDGSAKTMRPQEFYGEASYYWPSGSTFGGTNCTIDSLRKYRPGDKLP
jgi:prepilin-type N-terminal cleavage/methylation domain-containing protein/prepilin-type processing-associated H-X9-DG protein